MHKGFAASYILAYLILPSSSTLAKPG